MSQLMHVASTSAEVDVDQVSTSTSSTSPSTRPRSRSPLVEFDETQSPQTQQAATNIFPSFSDAAFDMLSRAVFINIQLIALCCITDLDSIKFAQYFGLIPKFIICSICGEKLSNIQTYKSNKGANKSYVFRCFKRSCRKNVTIFKNTWFGGRRVSIKKALSLTYCFLKKYSVQHTIEETSGVLYNNQITSTETIVDNNSYCREVMVETLFSSGEPKMIGGINCIVEIDEAKFGKRKYNRGRIVEGQWVLGGICRETKETFFLSSRR